MFSMARANHYLGGVPDRLIFFHNTSPGFPSLNTIIFHPNEFLSGKGRFLTSL